MVGAAVLGIALVAAVLLTRRGTAVEVREPRRHRVHEERGE